MRARGALGRDVESSTACLPWRKRGQHLYRPPAGALDRPGQQAPGFWAQKSSNCWALEPSGGAWSLVAESCPLSGAAVPPPVLSVVVPVLPVGVLVADGVVVSDELSLELSVDVLVSLLLSLLELLFDDAASLGDWSDCGTETSAGGPGTCVAASPPPPQPATATVSRPATTSAMMRPGIWLTPP
jgi:hypothetical protein